MKGRGSSNNGTPPQVAVQPTGANAVTTAPLPTEASPETLKQFNAAVVKGDESTVTSMLAAYPGIANQRKDTGDTPLHFAADYNRAAIAQRLVDAGADVNAVDNDGYSPLRIVSEKGFPDVASVLLQKGADVNAVDKKGWTALHLAAQNGNTSVAKLLLDNAADYTIKEHLGLTPLAVAKREGKASIIDLLRASGATQ
jgi:ankyrin repeat protein